MMVSVFRYLLQELHESVRVIVPFGIDSVKWFENLGAGFVDMDKVIWPFENEGERQRCHFGYAFSAARARAIGEKIKQRLQ